MNKHILLVMKYLKDPKSVSRDELLENSKSAHAACDTYGTYYAAVYIAARAAANAAYYAADYDADGTAHWVDEYFEHTGEDKQTYINELEKS